MTACAPAVEVTPFETPWSSGLITSTDELVHSVRVSGEKKRPGTSSPGLICDLADQLTAFTHGERDSLDVDAALIDSWIDAAALPPFMTRVLHELARVPQGSTLTYAELATRAGRPGAARAAGSSCARNPLTLIVPCHRVLPAHGMPGAYSATPGVAMKIALLRLEGAAAAWNWADSRAS